MVAPMMVIALPMMILGMVLAVVLAPITLMIILITGVVGLASTVRAALSAPFAGVLRVLQSIKPESHAVPRIA